MLIGLKWTFLAVISGFTEPQLIPFFGGAALWFYYKACDMVLKLDKP